MAFCLSRLFYLGLIFGCVALALIGRLFYLQIILGVFGKRKIPIIAKYFPQAPVGNFFVPTHRLSDDSLIRLLEPENISK